MHKSILVGTFGASVCHGYDIIRVLPGSEIRIVPPKTRRPGSAKPVYEPSSGLRWPSAVKLAEELGYSLGAVYGHLQGNPRYRTVAGRRFEYAD